MGSKIKYTKANERSFDGSDSDRYSADESASFSQNEYKQIGLKTKVVTPIYDENGQFSKDFLDHSADHIKGLLEKYS